MAADTVEKLTSLLFGALVTSSPILSGNMQSLIQINRFGNSECEIIIDAPFYDMNKWKKENLVVHTGEVINGKTAYAEWVNKSGGFSTHNKSEHWVNRACVEVAQVIASEIGAIVINELEL